MKMIINIKIGMETDCSGQFATTRLPLALSLLFWIVSFEKIIVPLMQRDAVLQGVNSLEERHL
ncbi:hypothetical protein ACFPVX_08060 [Cohnella faecalis]|uniref:hypothetical protein n=1 Tax=Cohnella faecalis TaxID=2315694 RepID=UPI0011C21AAE|nr:hypothetical protein [Cohnella faecalis]